jgi:hypothetical protein
MFTYYMDYIWTCQVDCVTQGQLQRKLILIQAK